jgi:hypothetical protein
MAIKYIYVNVAAGLDTNDGLSVATAKASLSSAKLILQNTDENIIYLAPGTYNATVDFTTAGYVVSLIGDYNGAIFGLSAGEVIWSQTANFKYYYFKLIERITLYLDTISSGLSFLYNSSSQAHLNLTFNYVLFKARATGYFISLFGSPWLKITFNDCSFYNLTTTFTWQQDAADGIGHTCFIMNNCNWLDNNLGINYLSRFLNLKAYNSTFLFFSYLWDYNSCCNHYYNTCNFKQYALNQRIGTINNSSAAKLKSQGKIIINTCNFYNPSNVYIDITILSYFLSMSQVDTNYSNLDTYFWSTNRACYLEMTNINGGTNNYYVNGNALVFTLENEIYNTKSVLKCVCVPNDGVLLNFKLTNLSPSTSYTLTLDYKKIINSNELDYTLYTGVSTSNLQSYDVKNNPSYQLTAQTWNATDHTYNTWYTKTFTFSTNSTVNEDYYFNIYTNSSSRAFKITQPTIALT